MKLAFIYRDTPTACSLSSNFSEQTFSLYQYFVMAFIKTVAYEFVIDVPVLDVVCPKPECSITSSSV